MGSLTAGTADRSRDRSWHRVAAGAIAVATVATLPSFLVGAMAVQLSAALHFGTVRLGLAVTAFYAAAAVSAIAFGKLADRLGGAMVLRAVGPITGLILAAMAFLVRSWSELVIALALAGASSSAGQPAANQYISAAVPAGRQGIAFGTKQASVPLAVMLSGLAVPSIAVTVGYRWAFAGAAVLAASTIFLVPRHVQDTRPRRYERRRGRPPTRGALIVFGISLGLGLAAASALSTYLVLSGVHVGLGKGAAGLVAALGGGVGVLGRIVVGHRADRRTGGHFRVVATMLAIGALAFACVGLSVWQRWPALFLPAAVICFAAGWGWNGLFNFAVVRAHPGNPGYATGMTQTGGRVGGIVGPPLFGLVAAHASYGVAWLVAGALAAIAAPTVLLARAMLRRAAVLGDSARTSLDRPGRVRESREAEASFGD